MFTILLTRLSSIESQPKKLVVVVLLLGLIVVDVVLVVVVIVVTIHVNPRKQTLKFGKNQLVDVVVAVVLLFLLFNIDVDVVDPQT